MVVVSLLYVSVQSNTSYFSCYFYVPYIESKCKMERMNICYVGKSLTMNLSGCWRMLWRFKAKILWETIVLDEMIDTKESHLRNPGRKSIVSRERNHHSGVGAWEHELAISCKYWTSENGSLTLFLEFQASVIARMPSFSWFHSFSFVICVWWSNRNIHSVTVIAVGPWKT